MTRGEFEAALAGIGFQVMIEDDPDGGESLAMFYKHCARSGCPQPWQQHFLGADSLYDPTVLALVLAKIREGDCGHTP